MDFPVPIGDALLFPDALAPAWGSRGAVMIARCLEIGWDIKRIPTGEKGPREPGWQNLKPSLDELERHLAIGGNVGVRLGASSGGLVDVDLDCPEALTLAEIYLPPTDAVFGRASKPRSHFLYVAAGAAFAAYSDPLTGETIVELRADGRHQLPTANAGSGAVNPSSQRSSTPPC